MNYGPLEFADYLRKSESRADSAIVRAARAAQPQPATPINLLRVASVARTPAGSDAAIDAVGIEAVATKDTG